MLNSAKQKKQEVKSRFLSGKIKLLQKFLCIAILLFNTTAKGQCIYHPALAGSDTAVTFIFSGGSFASFGCAPIDPTYWVAGSGAVMTSQFTTVQSYPSFRIWGMNDDDSASVSVNGLAYPLTLSSAAYDAKVVCGLSPGPDGVIFANGKLVGANSNASGNYSYQNVTIIATNVSSITVTGVSGAGWGYAGASTNCPPLSVPVIEPASMEFFPNPAYGIVTITGLQSEKAIASVMNEMGVSVKRIQLINNNIDISGLSPGIYFVKVFDGEKQFTKKLIIAEN